MEHKIGICGLCGHQCAVDAAVAENKILSVQKPKHPFLNSNLCVRGAALKQYVHHKDRIEHPMKRVGSKGSKQYIPISWSQAINEISQRLLQTKAESDAKGTVFYAGHPKWFRKVLAELSATYGTPNLCTESSTCRSAAAIAWQLVCGDAMVKPDSDHSKTHVIWSDNPGGGSGDNRAIVKMHEKGIQLIVVDPRVTATTETADLHLQLYPGTDGALALGIANVIINEGLEDKDYIEKYTYGYEEYKNYVMTFPPERVAKITGVPMEKIVAAARMMAGGNLSIRSSNCSVVHCINGVQNLRAVIMLLALTGSFGREGGNLTGFGPPKASLDNFHHVLATRPDIENDISNNEFPVWNEVINNEAQCIRLADVILEDKPYPIRNLICFGLNIGMWPDSDRVQAALRKVEFSVITELFWNEACEVADFVLPCCAAPEMDQVVVGKDNRLVLVERLIHPGDKLPDVEIMLRLAHAMDLHGPFLDQKDYNAYLNYTMRTTGVTLKELTEHPEGINARIVNPGKSFDLNCDFKTPTGKVEFCSSIIERYADLPGHDPLPIYTDWRKTIDKIETYPFILCAGPRKAYYFHSRTYRLRWISNLEIHTTVSIHPKDAKKLKVKEGDKIRLITPKGNLVYTIFLDGGIKQGVVCVYHDDGEQNVNRLFDKNYIDPISGFPGFRSYVCRLEKVEGVDREVNCENSL